MPQDGESMKSLSVWISVAFVSPLLALNSAVHAEGAAPTYSIKEEFSGSAILRKAVQGIYVPPDKTYAELTPEEKQRIKSFYEPMTEEDEPPYPEHGLRAILEAARELQHGLLVDGAMFLAVSVDASGKGTSVAVYQSPDEQLTRAMAGVLMFTTYKPAICHGVPCKMEYPFRFQFKVR